MATQIEIFRFIAPQFAAVSDEDVQIALDLAALFISVEAYPLGSRDLALALKAASILFVQAQSASGDGTNKVVTREKEGDLERSYSSSSSSTVLDNIYEEQLVALGYGTFGAHIMTRYGMVIPQGVEIDYYRPGPWSS